MKWKLQYLDFFKAQSECWLSSTHASISIRYLCMWCIICPSHASQFNQPIKIIGRIEIIKRQYSYFYENINVWNNVYGEQFT
jgi:hypothetical protein